MLGYRYARHSAIVEVKSDADKKIEQRQDRRGKMFPAHTQAGKRQINPECAATKRAVTRLSNDI